MLLRSEKTRDDIFRGLDRVIDVDLELNDVLG